MFRTLTLAALAAAGTGGDLLAQYGPRGPTPPPYIPPGYQRPYSPNYQQPYPSPYQPPSPQAFPPAAAPQSSPIDGPWYFRGDPRQPCSIETVATPAGPRLVFTNEKGTPAEACLSRDGRRVTIPDWNLVGTVRGNAIVWPNGDFWGR